MVLDSDIELYFSNSKHRKKVLFELSTKEQIASVLSQRLNIHRETISRIFKELKDLEFAYCTTEERYNRRKYFITQKGIEILKEL